MRALNRHCIRAVLLSALTVLCLALAAALVRLLPWLLSPEVPVGVALPFAKALFGVAAEAALLIGVPVGCALGSALLVERGEARALHCLGVSPLGLTLRVCPLVFCCALAALPLAASGGEGRDRPGRFARALVTEARAGCEAGRAHSISVPIVGVSWLCFPDAPARVVGQVPNSGGRAWFSAAGITVADDFTRFVAEDVFIGVPRGNARFGLSLRVGTAHVAGLPAWGAPSGLGRFLSGVLISLSLALMALGSVFVVARLAVSQPALAAGPAALAGVLSLRTLHALPASTHAGAAGLQILAVGLGVCLAPLVLAPMVRRLAEWYSAKNARA